MATQPKDFDIFKTIKNVVYCPECNEDPPNIGEEFSSGHLVCMSCGLVCGENIVDTRSEWRTFSNDDKPGADRNRVGDGGNPLLSGGQLYTKVGDGRGGHGTMVALSRTQQKVTKDKPNEKLLEIYTVIEAFCAYGKLNSTVVDASKHVAKLAIEGKWFPTFTEPVVCAIIFEGCKRGGESRNMKEIGRLSGKKTVFNRQLAMVNKKLTSGSQGDIDTNTGASRATFAKDLMPRYCQEIGLPVWAETLAVQVAEAVNDTLILGSRTARNVAASVIYLVCHLIGQPRTVTEIYSLAEQVKATVQKSIKIIYDNKEQIMKSPHWPTDKRINCDLFDNMMNSRWYSQESSEIGLKRKLESQERESPRKKFKSTSEELDSQDSTSSQDSDSQGTSSSVSSLSSRSILIPKLLKKFKLDSSSLQMPPTTDIPTRKPNRASDRPASTKYSFPPTSKQKIFIWNGLYLPGPI